MSFYKYKMSVSNNGVNTDHFFIRVDNVILFFGTSTRTIQGSVTTRTFDDNRNEVLND